MQNWEMYDGPSVGCRARRQAVGIPMASHCRQLLGVLLLQHLDAPSCYPTSPSRETSFPLFALLCGTCMIVIPILDLILALI